MMGGGIRPKFVNIARDGALYYANVCGLSRAIGVGKTPENAAKNLARELRREILESVKHDPRVLEGAHKPLGKKRAR
jgi:hypothetical protein